MCLHGTSSSMEEMKMMSFEMTGLSTRAQPYEKYPQKKYQGVPSDKDPPSSLYPSNSPLTIEKMILETILRPPKSTICKSVFNPIARDAQFNNIVKDLAQEPWDMCTFEVLQTFPTQRKNLLLAPEAVDSENSNTSTFNLEKFKSSLFNQLTVKIATKVIGRKVNHTILDKGAISTYFWRAIGSHEVNHYPTML